MDCGDRHERPDAGRHAASGSAPRPLTHGPDPRAPSRLRRPAAAVQRRLPRGREHPGVAGAHQGGPARAGLAGARHGQPAARDPRTGLLPPVRERLQPRRPGQRGFDPLGRAIPRRPGARAGVAVRPTRAPQPQTGARCRRRALRPVGRLPPAPARPRGGDPGLERADRRDDAVRHPGLPAATRRARRRARPDRGDGRQRDLGHKVEDLVAEREEGAFDAVFVAVGAHLSKRVDIPARDAGRIVDAVSFLRSVGSGERP